MQIVYAMDVIDRIAPGNARYVRRFTYETREEAWSRYTEAIKFGFEAYVEMVDRTARRRTDPVSKGTPTFDVGDPVRR